MEPGWHLGRSPTQEDLWLKVARSGNAFTAAYSLNGTDYTTVGTITNAAVGAATARVGVMADGPPASGTPASAFIMSGLKVDGVAVPFFDSVPPPVEMQLAAALEAPTWQGVDFGTPLAPRSWLAVVPAEVAQVSTTLTPVGADTQLMLTLNGHSLEAVDGAVAFDLAAGPNVLEARTIAPDGDSQTYRWVVVSLQPGVVVNTVPAAPAVAVDVAASTRCLASKAYVTVKATNGESVPVSLNVQTTYGERYFASVDPGKNAVHAFTTRAASVPAGTVTVEVTRVVDGATVVVDRTVSYEARSCG